MSAVFTHYLKGKEKFVCILALADFFFQMFSFQSTVYWSRWTLVTTENATKTILVSTTSRDGYRLNCLSVQYFNGIFIGTFYLREKKKETKNWISIGSLYTVYKVTFLSRNLHQRCFEQVTIIHYNVIIEMQNNVLQQRKQQHFHQFTNIDWFCDRNVKLW